MIESRITSMVVKSEGQPLFSEESFEVRVVDDGGGEFVEVCCRLRRYEKIAINPEEWPVLRDAIDKMVEECRG